jgi:hypothetical protein
MKVRREPSQTPANRALGAAKEEGVLPRYADRLSGETARCSGVSAGAAEGS